MYIYIILYRCEKWEVRSEGQHLDSWTKIGSFFEMRNFYGCFLLNRQKKRTFAH